MRRREPDLEGPKRRVELSPLLQRQFKAGAVGQGLICGNDARIQQELAHVLVRHTRRFLQQLLDGRTGAHIDALGFGMRCGGHEAAF